MTSKTTVISIKSEPSPSSKSMCIHYYINKSSKDSEVLEQRPHHSEHVGQTIRGIDRRHKTRHPQLYCLYTPRPEIKWYRYLVLKKRGDTLLRLVFTLRPALLRLSLVGALTRRRVPPGNPSLTDTARMKKDGRANKPSHTPKKDQFSFRSTQLTSHPSNDINGVLP